MALVTSRYTMDKQDSTIRQYLGRSANLIGATRLPNTAFKANAGTEVITDILFLQKRVPGTAASGEACRVVRKSSCSPHAQLEILKHLLLCRTENHLTESIIAF